MYERDRQTERQTNIIAIGEIACQRCRLISYIVCTNTMSEKQDVDFPYFARF